MQTKLARWASSLLVVVGVVLVAAFFFDWVRGGISGARLAWDIKHWLFLVPISGAALAITAGTRSQHTRLVAILAGLLVVGDVALALFRGVIDSGLDTWLLLGGAGVMIAGMADKRRSLRAVGGVAVLLSFFAPWDDKSMFRSLIGSDADVLKAMGINVGVMWLSGIAGVTAILSALSTKPWSRWVAAMSGIAVYASFFWVMGSVVNMILAWGAWATLGASATALVLGVLAPGQRVVAAAAPAPKA